jgi:hypothetical protein
MTMPPSLVERPLMPWPPLRIDSGTSSCSRAKASASTTSSTLSGRIASPGDPVRR